MAILVAWPMAYPTASPMTCGMNIVPIEAKFIALSHGLAALDF